MQDRQLKEYATNLHHLVSTKTIRGVYNPPADLMEVK